MREPDLDFISEEDFIYHDVLKKIYLSTAEAVQLSKETAGIYLENSRLVLASVLFTRLCTSAISLLQLCPNSPLCKKEINWDFASIASISRNIYECAINLYYFSFDPIEEDEWEFREKIMFLHDCSERYRLFKISNPSDSDLSGFRKQINELVCKLEENDYFISLTEKQQKKFIKGRKHLTLTRKEILTRMGFNTEHFQSQYKFLSSHVHSLPIAFFRMIEHGRGSGVKNRIDTIYISIALQVANEFMEYCINNMHDEFSDYVELSGNYANLKML